MNCKYCGDTLLPSGKCENLSAHFDELERDFQAERETDALHAPAANLAIKLVSKGRCPICAGILRVVICHCTRTHPTNPDELFGCPDCGGLGYVWKCPSRWAHKFVEWWMGTD